MSESNSKLPGNTKIPNSKRREDPPHIKLSKALSQTLRHGALKQGIKISSDGFVSVGELLSHSKFKNYTFSDIRQVVNTNTKKRFSLKRVDVDSSGDEDDPNNWYIKANQGHSLNVIEDLSLKPLVELDQFPEIVVHGTDKKAWDQIKIKGLSRMGRNHIHMASGRPGEAHVISGIRPTSKVLIFINIKEALSSEIPFFLSENGVILSPGNSEGYIPPSLFLRVEGV